MGIYDREYYRREGPGYLDSLIPSGQVCKWLILINVGLYILQLITFDRAIHSPGPLTEGLILDTDAVLGGQVWRLLTYAFLHSPVMWEHIVFNMLFLWWFGSDLEHLYGSREFLAFYLAAALLGGVAFQLYAGATGQEMFCLGASGAVTAVLVLCAFHFPHRTILVFFVLPVPIWLFVAFQVAQDAFYFLGPLKTETAVTVHLAGAAFAALYYKRHWRLLRAWDWIRTWKSERSRPRLRVYRGEEEVREPVPVAAPPSHGNMDEQLEAKLDQVLEKVARHGQTSLTENEKQILIRASEIYKRRRS